MDETMVEKALSQIILGMEQNEKCEKIASEVLKMLEGYHISFSDYEIIKVVLDKTVKSQLHL